MWSACVRGKQTKDDLFQAVYDPQVGELNTYILLILDIYSVAICGMGIYFI